MADWPATGQAVGPPEAAPPPALVSGGGLPDAEHCDAMPNSRAGASPVGPFRHRLPVRFGDCDPAGIVFYPRYVEMFNVLVEEWCEHGLGCSMQHLIQVQKMGMPTVNLNVDFRATSRWGEVLDAALSVVKLGTTSVTIRILLTGPDQGLRVQAQLVLVLMDLASQRAMAIAPDLRHAMQRFCID